jgi:hypothetical protein
MAGAPMVEGAAEEMMTPISAEVAAVSIRSPVTRALLLQPMHPKPKHHPVQVALSADSSEKEDESKYGHER